MKVRPSKVLLQKVLKISPMWSIEPIKFILLKGLTKQDSSKLKKSKKGVEKLDNEIEDLRNNIFYFIKNLDETSVRGSNFYITVLAYN